MSLNFFTSTDEVVTQQVSHGRVQAHVREGRMLLEREASMGS